MMGGRRSHHPEHTTRRASRSPRAPAALLACVALVASLPSGVLGQSGFCFPGEPSPDCRVVGILETSVVQRVVGGTPVTTEEDRTDATWQVGALVNTSDDQAWGGTFLVGTGTYRPRLALRLRHRRWLTDRWTMDLDVGPMTHSTSLESWGVGVMADVGVGYGDYGGALLRLEVLPTAGGGTTTAGMIGARVGSWPAVVGNGVLGILGVIWLFTADFQ